ncbi:MAG: sigma-54-dependent Fis family transcriptional regulator [Desulfobacterales bacterium]|nr:sigma-54-dependent Fis family transcriptional regulator [Desulfobacterales bacterium]
MYNILIFEEDSKCQEFFHKILATYYSITVCPAESDVRKALKSKGYDVIILDLQGTRKKPFGLLHWIQRDFSYIPVIAVSRASKPDLIVKAIKHGAFDFVPKPLSKENVCRAVEQALEHKSLKNERDYLRRSQDVVYNFDKVVAESPVMKDVIFHLKKYSETDSTLLMTGETGTGKSFLSGTVHFNSFRRKRPFISINCANIPETLLESELFGHEKGAFTDANKLRIGRFEQAKGGTVFLDEIGELSLPLQAKLLRVLDEKRFERVGGSETINADIRFIAATNKNLEKLMNEGGFREDLYYRIQVLSVALPPLRERKLCIEALSYYLLEKIARSLKKQISDFSGPVIGQIKSYSWPGNIRELHNRIEQSVILEDTGVIQEKNFSMGNAGAHIDSNGTGEKEAILRALEMCLWIQKDAAKMLGISPRSLNYKIRKYGITHPRWRKNK